MDIKIETAAQMESRLRKVVSHATFKIYDEPYSFQEIPLKEFSFQFDQNALAVVRDDTIVSQFIPSRSKDQERFAIFRFHFDPEIPNSGFVGWLASHLKQTTGTGVFVVCGHNSKHGGVYDYWGCPWEIREKVLNEVKKLKNC